MNASLPADLLRDLQAIWEDYRPTRLIELPALACLAGVGRVVAKAEWERPLGNFKALGGMVAGLRALARAAGVPSVRALLTTVDRTVPLPPLVCASDGNHGLAVAAAARRAGTRAIVYLPASVSRARVERIRDLGGEVVGVAGTYDDAVDAAKAAASLGGGLLLPDTSRDPHDPVVQDVMAGYAVLTAEIVDQLRNEVHARPSHLFVQAGVGGLAAAMAEGLGSLMQAPANILIVEPQSAACVARALKVGRPERIHGDLHTSASMLSCGIASTPAVEILSRHGARSVVVDEAQLEGAAATLRHAVDVRTTPSGAAGVAGLLHVARHTDLRREHALAPDSTVLLAITEGDGVGLAGTAAHSV